MPVPDPWRTIYDKRELYQSMLTNDVVARLVRAANQTDKLGAIEVHRLLDHAVSKIIELRQAANIVPIRGRDALIYIQTVAAGADRVPAEEWHHGLLHAAEMLRDLHIVVESGTLIQIVPHKER